MENTFYFIAFGIVMVFHLPLAFFTSKEIVAYPLWPKTKKLGWLNQVGCIRLAESGWL